MTLATARTRNWEAAVTFLVANFFAAAANLGACLWAIFCHVALRTTAVADARESAWHRAIYLVVTHFAAVVATTVTLSIDATEAIFIRVEFVVVITQADTSIVVLVVPRHP